MELAARPQNACDRGNALVLDEAPLPMPPFRPGIRIDQFDARERSRRQPLKQRRRVIEMQPDIRKRLQLDRRKRLGHSVDERLDADEPDARVLLGLRDHVLSAAESDLEADLVHRIGE
jgi:hypothetical protein